jgi:hypothetical protein
MVRHEPSLLLLLAAILFTGILLIATPFSALGQQQPENITTATTQQQLPPRP